MFTKCDTPVLFRESIDQGQYSLTLKSNTDPKFFNTMKILRMKCSSAIVKAQSLGQWSNHKSTQQGPLAGFPLASFWLPSQCLRFSLHINKLPGVVSILSPQTYPQYIWTDWGYFAGWKINCGEISPQVIVEKFREGGTVVVRSLVFQGSPRNLFVPGKNLYMSLMPLWLVYSLYSNSHIHVVPSAAETEPYQYGYVT